MPALPVAGGAGGRLEAGRGLRSSSSSFAGAGRSGGALLDGAGEGSAGEEPGRVESGQRRIIVVHDEGNFGTAEDDGIASLVLHARDGALMEGDSLGGEDSADQFLHDEAVDLITLGRGGAQAFNAERGKLIGVDAAVDEPAGAEQADAAEAAEAGFFRDDEGDVEPGPRGTRFDQGKRLMDGVVGADEEIGAGAGELMGGVEHEVADARPAGGFNGAHIFGEGEGTHGYFRMGVSAEDGRSLKDDGAVAESRALGGAGNNTDMCGHGEIVITKRRAEAGFGAAVELSRSYGEETISGENSRSSRRRYL